MPLDYTIRHSESAGDLGPAIARTIRELDPDIPAAPVVPLSRYVRDALAPTRFALVCLGVFAGIALVLASVGLHGVLAYTVRQRTRELAVRMAFGAGRGRLLRLVLGDALLLIGAGLATGLAGALLVTRLLAGLVFGVSTTDPVTFAGLSLLLGVVSLAACLSAALRATRLDPVVALRSE